MKKLIPVSILFCQMALASSDLTQLSVSSFQTEETCMTSQKIPKGFYTDNDIEKENLLCSQAFESANSLFGTCPKLINTNPGVEVYFLDNTISKSEFEKKYCPLSHMKNVKIPFKKIGKFKSTVTCSYTPSLVSYYHLSRYFGNILNVPVAVVRQTSPEFILKQVDRAQKTSGLTGVIKATWSILKKLILNPNEPKSKFLYNDQKIYGALVANPTGEEDFLEYMNDAEGIQLKRAEAFKKEDVFLQLSNVNSIKDLFPSQITRNEKIARVSLLKDFSDMIILDTLLSQEDRYNNIAYKVEFINTKTFKKIPKAEINPSAPEQLSLKRLVLKDNDCGVAAESGVARTNINVKAEIINALSHMRPETFQKLQELARDLASEELTTYFKKQSLMTPADYQKFKLTTIKIAKALKSKCQMGQLKLDLDLNMIDQDLPAQNCDM